MQLFLKISDFKIKSHRVVERKTPYFCGFIYVLEKEIVVIFPLTSCKPR